MKEYNLFHYFFLSPDVLVFILCPGVLILSEILGTIVGILVLWIILRGTNDAQPLVEAITTVAAFGAQVRMMTRVREDWID